MPINNRKQSVPTGELLAALRRLRHGTQPAAGELLTIDRIPSRNASSFPLEEIIASYSGGSNWSLLFKNTGATAISESAKHAKPGFLIDSAREIDVYINLLSSGTFGTAAFHGSVVDETLDRYWLFIENVRGRELYKVGDNATWTKVAEWLAAFHAHFAAANDLRESAQRLIRYDFAYFHRWLERATAFASGADEKQQDSEVLTFLRALAPKYSGIIHELTALPATVLHGDFYASNILVAETPEGGPRICPVDWEQAAIGPGLIDLAAFTAGNWTEEQRRSFARDYFNVIVAAGWGPLDWDEFLRAFDLCRLHLAVQWLGWSSRWSPPPEHRQDWLREARTVAERVT